MAKPEKVFKMGAVRASIFRNVLERNGESVPIAKVILEVRYRDKAGQWQGTNSLSINEVPKAITALQKAYEYLVADGGPDLPEAAGPVPASSLAWQRKP